MKIRFATAFLTLLLVCFTMTAQNQIVDVVLPTDNGALFSGGGPAFYHYIERNYKGVKCMPWEGGQFGFVRDPIARSACIVFSAFHEGIAIGALRRVSHG